VPPDPDIILAQTEYVRQLGLSQGTPPVTWSLLQAPSTPPGVHIDPNTGLINGWIPTNAQVGTTVTFQVQASNAQGSATATWHVNVTSSYSSVGSADPTSPPFGATLQAGGSPPPVT